MRHLTRSLFAAALFAAPALHAQTVVTAVGATYTTKSLSSAATFGSSMAGMRVTAYFNDGASDTSVWGALGDGLFGAGTSRFRLALPGDENTGAPFSFLWTLDNLGGSGLTRLVLSGAPGGTVFDMNGDEELTPNSALGIPLAFAPGEDWWTPSPYAAGATVTYRNAVALVGSQALGDVFEQVDLVFGLALGGGAGLAFDLDTDSVGEGASLDPIGGGGSGGAPVTTTPEPATVALLAGGLAVVGGVGARRRRARA